MSLMPIDMTPPAPRKQNFGTKLGDILFALATGGPSPGRYKELVQQRQQQADQGILHRAMAEAQARAQFPDPVKPQGIPLGNGGFGEYLPGKGLTVLREPTQQDPSAVQVARAAGLTPGTPEWRAALVPAIPGYGYTAPAIQAKAAAQKDVAGYRADRSAGLKAQPTYAQTHPKAAGGGGAKAPKLPTGFILD